MVCDGVRGTDDAAPQCDFSGEHAMEIFRRSAGGFVTRKMPSLVNRHATD
jgi:hypothetical protein